MAIGYNTGSSPNTNWTSFTSTGTSGTDEIYVRTSTDTGAFSTLTDQKVSKVYVNNGSTWVEVFSSVAYVPPATPTLAEPTGFNFGSIWNTRTTQVNMIWSAVTNATSYELTATNTVNSNDVKTATLTSSTTSSKNLTVSGLTPGQTYSISVVAKASGYNNSPASQAKTIRMGTPGVAFSGLNLTPGYTVDSDAAWLFSRSENRANCNIGNSFTGTVTTYTDDTYVGYRSITKVEASFKYYGGNIYNTNGTNFDTFLVFNNDNGSVLSCL